MHFRQDVPSHENKILSGYRYASHLRFRAAEVAETKDLDENTSFLDLDKNVAKFALSPIEHASERAECHKFSYEQITP